MRKNANGQHFHACLLACQPVSQPASRPAGQPASRPANQPASQPTSHPARPIKPPSDRADKKKNPQTPTQARCANSDVQRRGRRQRRSLQIRPPNPRGDGRGRVARVAASYKPLPPINEVDIPLPTGAARFPPGPHKLDVFQTFTICGLLLTSTWLGLSWAPFCLPQAPAPCRRSQYNSTFLHRGLAANVGTDGALLGYFLLLLRPS